MILKDLRISASVFNEVCFLITQNVREKIEAEPGTGMFESLHDLCVGSIYYYHISRTKLAAFRCGFFLFFSLIDVLCAPFMGGGRYMARVGSRHT